MKDFLEHELQQLEALKQRGLLTRFADRHRHAELTRQKEAERESDSPETVETDEAGNGEAQS